MRYRTGLLVLSVALLVTVTAPAAYLRGHIDAFAAYGPVGDGVTDDRAAIQARIDAGPGTVFLGPGTFRVTDTLLLRSHVTIQCAGMALTTIKLGDAVQKPVIGFADYTQQYRDVHIRDCTIHGNRAKNPHGGGGVNYGINDSNAIWGIQFANVQHGTIHRVRVLDAATGGIVVFAQSGRTTEASVSACHVENSGILSGSDRGGLDIGAPTTDATLRVTVTGCSAVRNPSVGLAIEGIASDASAVEVRGNTIADNGIGGTSPGIKVVDFKNATIAANAISGNTAQGIYVDAANDVTISGNLIRANTLNGILVNNATTNSTRGRRITINGNTIEANRQAGIRTMYQSNGSNTPPREITISGNALTDNGASGALQIEDIREVTLARPRS